MKNIIKTESEGTMKKLLILLLIPTILLCGCHANSEKEDVSEYYEELSKAQEISILPANTSTATQTLTESEEISDFILALDMELWEMKTLPKKAELAGIFQLSQEETIKFGESATDGELYSVCEILCYLHRIWEYGFTPHTPAVCEKEILPLLKLLRTVGNR